MKGSDIRSDGDQKGYLSIQFETEQQTAVEDITYITLMLHSADRGFGYSFDLPLDDAWMNSALLEVSQALMDSGVLKAGERFDFSLAARTGDAMLINPLLDRAQVKSADVPTIMLKAQNAPPASGDSADMLQTTSNSLVESDAPPIEITPLPDSPPAGADSEDIKIEVIDVEDLIKPIEKSMDAYPNLQMCGLIAQDDMPIFFRRGAMAEAHKSAVLSKEVTEEVGGFMLGNVCRDTKNGRMFVEIAEVVPTDKAKGTYVRLDFNYQAWRQVLDKIDAEFPDKFPVGWYHTHLISQAVLLPVVDMPRQYEADYRTFFSQADVFLHRNFFPEMWDVDLVLDVKLRADVFFGCKNGHIAQTQGYYLYGD
ncbi:MAG: hypothetical protein IPK17_17540 [Chloroflexi bacterium]|uniref:hypothetical protein n=1 Tax=Candidatus Flexifilum breve TaxID=3140694 RepID=UPI0031369960|nr:hypothetical protein [Chloroflexota bacterium]